MSKRERGFDKLWRWRVTDDLEMPDGSKITVTARRLTRTLKGERDSYAFKKAREMNRLLADKESDEYKEFLLPQESLSKEDLLKVLEFRERLQLEAKAQKEFLSPSPSEKDDEPTTLKERLDLMDQDDETMLQLAEERSTWVSAQLKAAMAEYETLDRETLLDAAKSGIADGIANAVWWEAYSDASLKLGIFVGDKPFFDDWPTEADDDLKAKLLDLYRDADAAAFDFSS